MKILESAYHYSNKQDFQLLTNSIAEKVEQNELRKYVDTSWQSRKIREEWNSEYISTKSKRVYRLEGSNYTTTFGEEKYEGNWKIIRDEKILSNGNKRIKSEYKIVTSGIGIFAVIGMQLTISKSENNRIEIKWSERQGDIKQHSNLIISTVEYGIISAFEDLAPETAHYEFVMNDVRYHPIDTSFTLLNYAANRNVKRAFFKEIEDQYPIIDSKEIKRRFRPKMTIVKYNNE